MTDVTAGKTALQVVGELTGCDLTVSGSQLLVQGPSLAVAKGAMKLVDRFIKEGRFAQENQELNGVLAKAQCISE